MKRNKILVALLATFALVACDSDYLSVQDTSTITSDKYQEIIKSDPSVLQNSVSALYSTLYMYSYSGYETHDDAGIGAIFLASDHMGEDVVQTKSHWYTYDYQLDFRLENYRRPYGTWKTLYTVIGQANDVIALVDLDAVNSTANDATIKTLRYSYGQALAMRAYAYMFLVQIFQNPFTAAPDASGAHINLDKKAVPLYYASNEPNESDYSRGTVGKVLTSIEQDLLTAERMLDGYARATKSEVDAHVVDGLLARYYLTTGAWDKAADYAKKAAAGFTLMEKEELLNGGFIDISSKEWIWGFDIATQELALVYASWYSHISNIAPGYAGAGYAPRAVDRRLYEQIDTTDYRKAWFNGPKGDKTQPTEAAQGAYASLKFGDDGNWTMDYPYMRAAEMYLIEAEALARQGNETGAAEALKPLMEKRCSAWDKTAVSVDDVLLQRRIELWGEGFALFDLKRNYRGIDRTYNGTNHRAPDGLLKVDAGDVRWTYQIPLSELQENSDINSADQNP